MQQTDERIDVPSDLPTGCWDRKSCKLAIPHIVQVLWVMLRRYGTIMTFCKCIPTTAAVVQWSVGYAGGVDKLAWGVRRFNESEWKDQAIK